MSKGSQKEVRLFKKIKRSNSFEDEMAALCVESKLGDDKKDHTYVSPSELSSLLALRHVSKADKRKSVFGKSGKYIHKDIQNLALTANSIASAAQGHLTDHLDHIGGHLTEGLDGLTDAVDHFGNAIEIPFSPFTPSTFEASPPPASGEAPKKEKKHKKHNAGHVKFTIRKEILTNKVTSGVVDVRNVGFPLCQEVLLLDMIRHPQLSDVIGDLNVNCFAPSVSSSVSDDESDTISSRSPRGR
eukprot:gene32753-40425_t